jgi:hypothetical protein
MGRHLREHKWQKIKFVFVPRCWDRLNRGLWISPKEGLTTIATVVSILSALVASAIAVT